MPFKTIRDVAGVLTISRKDDAVPFTSEDVEILGPLLGNASFTYENLRLLKEKKESASHLASMEKVVQVINSSLKGGELLRVILDEIQSVSSFDLAIILMKDDTRPNNVRILDFVSASPVHLLKGAYHSYKGSTFEKILRQGVTLIVEDTSSLVHESEKGILCRQQHRRTFSFVRWMQVLRVFWYCAQRLDPISFITSRNL